jgi:hypothetical protein
MRNLRMAKSLLADSTSTLVWIGICTLLCGCNSNSLELKGEATLSITNQGSIYLVHELDGVLLGLKVHSKGQRVEYVPIQLASQPYFPKTSAIMLYSEKAQAIWLRCNGPAFSATVYYSFRDKKCVDSRYGRMLATGSSSTWASPEFRSDVVPETPDDVREVLNVELGSANGSL